MHVHEPNSWPWLTWIPVGLAVYFILFWGNSLWPKEHVCPRIHQYSPTFMKRAADEAERLPPDSKLRVLLDDYKLMRNQTRACRGDPRPSTNRPQ